MDTTLIDDFFDFSRNLERVQIAGGQTEGYSEVKEDDMFDEPAISTRPFRGTDYAAKYQARQRKMMRESYYRESQPTTSSGIGDIDELTSIGGSFLGDAEMSLKDEELSSIFSRYDFTKKHNISLPITRHKDRILKQVETSQTCVIVGKTGCGKSTQVPQFLLRDCRDKNIGCNIIVTQPRRIAAMSLAKRVCWEYAWQVGSLVGYQIGLDRVSSEDTRLLYVTTGVLLQILIADKSLTRFTHIVVDEVHERSQEMDFLLIVIRQFLHTNSRRTKVILMSATINCQKFADYFSTGSPSNEDLLPAPSVFLDSDESSFPIEIFYLCSLKSLVPNITDVHDNTPNITIAGFKLAVRLIGTFDRIEVGHQSRGAVLVFLPGIHEIEELYNRLMERASDNKWWIRPLHSTITSEEQDLVFKRPPSGYRKIILSTNIAESSITVPDITFIVDFVLTKEMVCDISTNFQSLQLVWASKNNCIQRAGRSGRVAPGRVFRLVPKSFFDDLPSDNLPELLRGSMEQTVLKTKLLQIGSPRAVLALALDPPVMTKIEKTILLLKEKGALLHTLKGKENLLDGDITFLGYVMAKLPLDPVISKLIVLGHVFSVLPECVIMGAAMSVKSVFSTPFQERLKAYHSKLTWADSSCSDCIAFLNAYSVWKKNMEIGYFRRSVGGGEVEWARRYHIQIKAMHEVNVLVEDIFQRLHALKIEIPKNVGRVNLTNLEKPLVLKVVLAGAFYPNYFARSSIGGQIDEREAVKVLNGRDPFSTVYLMNFPMSQPRLLYAKRIRDELYDCCPDIRVSFDSSSKVYVEFGHHQFPSVLMHNHNYVPTIPGKVAMGVYRALKFRQLGLQVDVPLLRPAEAKERAIKLGLLTGEVEVFRSVEKNPENDVCDAGVVKQNPLPSIRTTTIELIISHVIDAGHFWAQSIDTLSTQQQKWMFEVLYDERNLVPMKDKPTIGKVFAARYSDDGNQYQYYRARVDAINKHAQKTVIQVFFIDYGNSATVYEHELMYFNTHLIDKGLLEIPAQAFECVLAEVQPSASCSDTGLWTAEATEAFRIKTVNIPLFGEIYSVVHGVIHMVLKLPNLFNINEWLVKARYADEAEESFLSKENHRVRLQTLEPFETLHYDEMQKRLPSSEAPDVYVESPVSEECPLVHKLRGPISPLEMNIHSLMRIGQRRMIIVDKESVNSVLLDTDPQDPHERIVVAANISENEKMNRISLRHTTLMPNIHGLPALLCLIFAPIAEFRTDPKRTRYTGAVCGLGFNPNFGGTIYADHDVSAVFDTEFTLEDIQDINRLRTWMNECLMPEDDEMFISETSILNAQINVKELLFSLIQRKRTSCEPITSQKSVQWGIIKPEHLMPPFDDDKPIKQNRAVFRLLRPVRMRLTDEERELNLSHKETNELLRRIAFKLTEVKLPLTCPMCNVLLEKSSSVRAHLATTTHLNNERHLDAIIQLDEDDNKVETEH